MPYKLRKAPKKNLYWVVTTETGKKHSKNPIPLDKAKAQKRILESALVGELRGGVGIADVKEFLRRIFGYIMRFGDNREFYAAVLGNALIMDVVAGRIFAEDVFRIVLPRSWFRIILVIASYFSMESIWDSLLDALNDLIEEEPHLREIREDPNNQVILEEPPNPQLPDWLRELDGDPHPHSD
jgi:hypothetical protein